MVNNPSGKNQHGEKSYPSDDVLKAALHQCVVWKYSQTDKLKYLKRELGLDIKRTSLYHLEKRLNIPSVRKPRLLQDEIDKIVVDFIAKDKAKRNSPNAIKSMLQDKLIMVPRDRIRVVMRAIAPEGFELRLPGKKRKLLPCVALMSFGPFHEVSTDRHKKLNAQALRMGDISLPIYAYRDKWSRYILKLVLLPNSRKSGAIGHVYLDLVEEYGGVPVQLTTDLR